MMTYSYEVDGCFNCPFNRENSEDEPCCILTSLIRGEHSIRYLGYRERIPEEHQRLSSGQPEWCPLLKETSFTIYKPKSGTSTETEDDDVLL